MSLFSKLFGGGGGGSAPKAQVEEYKGFAITPMPQREGGRYRIAADVEKEVNGEVKSHHLIRADVLEDLDSANEASVNKAKQLIDQMGERLFD